ncbi:hypothetical protein [Paraburkholderia caribensis]|uniref:hypothetical protein n=1 Tax=Paraburkholderia caribensis TaxID=75105 RepID=UPI001CB55BEA|nr:hypothetical protein [Paraburkholderia caribensis]CAG9262163.1 hypothetical protein PCAR4_560014 [Paraburkholderia caribensis]
MRRAQLLDEIDIVLTDWYEWSQGYEPALGFGGASSSCRGFRISNQWMDHDDLSHLVESQLRETTGKAVEPIVMGLAMHHRIAVMTAVRTFVEGAPVFQNPQNPQSQDEEYAEAKLAMRPALIARGVISRDKNRVKDVSDVALHLNKGRL